MITAIVPFKLPANIDAAKAAELFRGSAPKYQALKGLVRKYYLFDAESRTGGGCYLWESREAAERVYNAEWRKMITDRYGSAPEISYFETPVIVDNSQSARPPWTPQNNAAEAGISMHAKPVLWDSTRAGSQPSPSTVPRSTTPMMPG